MWQFCCPHKQHGLQCYPGYSRHYELLQACTLQARSMGKSRLLLTTAWALSPSALWQPRPALVRLPLSMCCMCTCSQSGVCRLPACLHRVGASCCRVSLHPVLGPALACALHSLPLWSPVLPSLLLRIHCTFWLSLGPHGHSGPALDVQPWTFWLSFGPPAQPWTPLAQPWSSAWDLWLSLGHSF